MGKKNQKHKEATRRKQLAESTLTDIGLRLKDPLCSIGLVFEHIGLSQLAFEALKNIEDISNKYTGIDSVIFVRRSTPSITNVATSIFAIRDIIEWDRPLIATSIPTCLDAINSRAPFIYHYVYDLDFINNLTITAQNIQTAFCDKRVRIFVRSEYYKPIVENEFNIKVVDVIENFDLKKMIKVIMGDMKNV
jgi:hypothetical protein